MDGQRFDEVTRLLGGGASRRSVVKGIFGAAVGAVGIKRGTAQAGECLGQGQTCTDSAQCCTDLVCTGNAETPGTCVEACGANGSDCGVGGDCCSGVCDGETCVAACKAEGEVCETAEDCCDSSLSCLSDGETTVCTATCGAQFNGCGDDTDCCPGYACVDGGKGFYCDFVCYPEGAECGVIQDGYSCCEGFTCDPDSSVCVAVCVELGETCGADEDCCAGVCIEGVCAVEDTAGRATVTNHVATCPSGVGPDIFDRCHDNVVSGVTFTINANTPDPAPTALFTATSGSDGVAGPVAVGAGDVAVSEDAAPGGDYVGVYVYCAEQGSGTVLIDGDAPDGAVGFAVADGDDVVCDWYLLTEAPAAVTPTVTPATGGVTTLPNTGAASAGGGGASPLLGAAAIGGAAAFLAARKLRQDAAPAAE